MRSSRSAPTLSESSLHGPLWPSEWTPKPHPWVPLLCARSSIRAQEPQVRPEDLSLQSCLGARGLWQTLAHSDRSGGSRRKDSCFLPPATV